MPTHRVDGRSRFAFGHWGSRVALGVSIVALIVGSALVQPGMLRLLVAVGDRSSVKDYLVAVALWLGPLLIILTILKLQRFKRAIELLGASCVWLLLWIPAIALNPYGRGGSDHALAASLIERAPGYLLGEVSVLLVVPVSIAIVFGVVTAKRRNRR
jgi:hypothetical protein